MGKKCISCGTDIGWNAKSIPGKQLLGISQSGAYHDEIFDKLKEKDVMCTSCADELNKRHAVEIWKYNQEVQTPEQFEKIISLPESQSWAEVAKQKLSMNEESNIEIPFDDKNNQSMSAVKLRGIIVNQTPVYKQQWDKNGIVQFKNDRIAILQRVWGAQVQFIVAYDQLTKEGYRLMAIDEGKSGGQASGGFTGGVNAYFYFQKMDFVR